MVIFPPSQNFGKQEGREEVDSFIDFSQLTIWALELECGWIWEKANLY
jgi:hypothetical protein